MNKVSTAIQLRFDVQNSPALPDTVRERLLRLAGKRISTDGVLTIEASRYRTQEQNRLDARQRLAALIQKATEAPKPRRPTQPSLAARQQRLENKRRRGQIKHMRRAPSEDR